MYKTVKELHEEDLPEEYKTLPEEYNILDLTKNEIRDDNHENEIINNNRIACIIVYEDNDSCLDITFSVLSSKYNIPNCCLVSRFKTEKMSSLRQEEYKNITTFYKGPFAYFYVDGIQVDIIRWNVYNDWINNVDKTLKKFIECAQKNPRKNNTLNYNFIPDWLSKIFC